MNTPESLLYSKSHEWIQMTGENSCAVGLSDHAQEEMGDVVFVNLPEVGDTVTVGGTVGDIESVKAVSDIYSPVSGTISEINTALDADPGAINKAPYETWIFKVENITDKSEMLTREEYEKFVKEGD